MRPRKDLRWFLVAGFASCAFAARAGSGEERAERGVEIDGLYDYDGYPPYVRLLEAFYLPPRAGERETVRLRFYAYPHLPRGTVLSLTLEYLGADYLAEDFKFPGGEDFAIEWKPSVRLASGEYYVRSRIHPEKQPREIRAVLEADPKRFPMDRAPWPYLYMKEDLAIVVGGGLADLAEYEEVKQVYERFAKDLFESFAEFRAKAEAAKEGKEFAADGKFDAKAFEEFVSSWRKKQAEIQEKIVDLQFENPRLFVESRTAYVRLQFLGRMVSKLSRKLMKDVTDARGAPALSPETPRGFDSNYRYPVDEKILEAERDVIFRIVESLKPEAPKPREEEPEED